MNLDDTENIIDTVVFFQGFVQRVLGLVELVEPCCATPRFLAELAMPIGSPTRRYSSWVSARILAASSWYSFLRLFLPFSFSTIPSSLSVLA